MASARFHQLHWQGGESLITSPPEGHRAAIQPRGDLPERYTLPRTVWFQLIAQGVLAIAEAFPYSQGHDLQHLGIAALEGRAVARKESSWYAALETHQIRLLLLDDRLEIPSHAVLV